jgi:lysophospholipase L1-like esterase
MLLAKIALTLGSLAFVLLAGELAGRIYHRVVYTVPVTATMRVHGDGVLGWEGKKLFGDPDSPRPKILVLGDSMTHGLGVEDNQLYATVLGRALGAEIFLYAGSGYGTLQEALALDMVLPLVRLDLVVLQVSGNDFINNSLPLERASYLNNNFAERPYLVGDCIEYHFPARFGATRLFVARHSRLAYELVVAADRVGADLARRGFLRGVESDIFERGLAFPPFAMSVGTTERIIERMRLRLDGITFVALAADAYLAPWRQIFARQGIPFIEDAVHRVHDEERRGAALRLQDGAHWNAAGHEVVGRVLAEKLSTRRASPVPSLVVPVRSFSSCRSS